MSGRDAAGARPSLFKRLRRRWRQRACVTICVPAYMAGGFIAETLQSISRQTYRTIKVLISVDPSTDNTIEACGPFLADPRFSLVSQPKRLGWPGNVNYLLDQVRTDYFCIVLHDDLIDPDYVARLMRALRRAPSTICAYPLMQRFGQEPALASIAGVTGDPYARAMAFLARPLNAVALRGVTRSAVLRSGQRLRDLGTGGFFAEFLWAFELALLGDCRRVRRTRYHSRYRADSVSKGWRAWPAERKRAGWRALLRQFNQAVAQRNFSEQQRDALMEAMLRWAYQLESWMPAGAEERSAIADPAKLAAMARAWRDAPDGEPPFL